MILVDANVWIDLIVDDPVWAAWSTDRLAAASDEDGLAVNPIIYAEVTVDEPDQAAFDRQFLLRGVARLPLPYEAAFVAGKAFKEYRRRGGVRRSPLPDFYIGAHAAVEGMPLITRDAKRYRSYFPSLELIAPDTHRP